MNVNIADWNSRSSYMPYREWSDDFLTGNSKMDQQHKEGLKILNEFYDTLNMENLYPNLIRLLDNAIAYTEYHFKDEEDYMAKHHSHDLVIQKKEHTQIKEELLAFKKRLDDDLLYISQPVTNKIKKWIEGHLTELDKNYGIQ